jgi:uncharacterized damage-inducible protein DinB
LSGLGKDGLGRLLAYTEWANHRVMRGAATVSTAEWKKDLGSSHGGVRGTLVHMLWAEWVWLQRFKRLPNPAKFDEGEFQDVTELSERWRQVNEHRQAWFRELGEGAADEVVPYRTMDGREWAQPLGQLVQHTANHATHHRGQVVAMLRMLGAKGIVTDLLIFDREKAEQAEGRSYGQSSS